MLAQSFQSAADLGLSTVEYRALITVLGMLERGDLVQTSEAAPADNAFNMGAQGKGCGTPACIGGWVARILGVAQAPYVDGFEAQKRLGAGGLADLYWNEIGVYECDSTEQAATALRSYLTTGDAKWHEAVA